MATHAHRWIRIRDLSSTLAVAVKLSCNGRIDVLNSLSYDSVELFSLAVVFSFVLFSTLLESATV